MASIQRHSLFVTLSFSGGKPHNSHTVRGIKCIAPLQGLDASRTGHYEYGSVLPASKGALLARNKRAVTEYLLNVYGAATPAPKDVLADVPLPGQGEVEQLRSALGQPDYDSGGAFAKFSSILFPGACS